MPSQPSSAPQAKILQGRAVRTLIAVVIIGAMLLALRWYEDHKTDIKDQLSGKVDSVGMVEAIEYGDNGDHVVAFNDKGQKIEQAAIKAGARDEDPVWRPDGNRIFFVSDRDGKSYQVYRWIPAPGNEPEARSLGSLGKSHPTFPIGVATDPDASMLLVSGGFVDEFDPSDLKGHQVLPPQGNGVTVSTEEGGGGDNQFSGAYGELGDRFRVARWQKGTDAIVAVMGSDRGEVLVYQDLTKPAATTPPVPIANGAHIDFDVSPTDGAVVFTVQGYNWQPGTKVPVDKRFRHCVGIWRPVQGGLRILLPSRDDSIAFGSPAISPAGDKVLIVEGVYNRTSENLESKGLITMPTEGNAAAGAAKLVEGGVYEPTWNAKGDAIAYAKVGANGTRGIYIAGPDGSDEHTLTGDTGTYGHPLFSPQTKP